MPLGGVVESVFLGCQDLGPSICEQILVSFELLLLLFQDFCHDHKPSLKANLFCGILRYAEFIIAEAHLIFGGGHVVVLLQVSVRHLSGLLEGRLIGIVFIFGTIRIVFVPCDGIVVAGLGAAPMTPMLCFLP